MTDRTERLAAAMERFLAEVRGQINEETAEQYDEHPCEEVNGDNGLPERSVPLSYGAVRENVLYDFEASGEDVNNVDCSNFFEWVADELYGIGISKDNPYAAEQE